MKCHVCGLELPENAVFCGNCGAKVIPVAAEPVPAPVVEEVIPEAPVVEEPGVAEVFQEEPAPVVEPVMEPVAEPVVEAPVFEAAPAVEPVAEPAAAEPVYTAPVYATATAAAATATAAPQAQPVYQAPVYQTVYQTTHNANRPALQLPVNRGFWKMFLLSIVTLGIYPMVVYSNISEEINISASRYDGERTKNYLWAGVLAGLTLGIYGLVWTHGMCRRMGTELTRRGINYKFNAASFWLWSALWPFIVAIGYGVAVLVLGKVMGMVLALIGICLGIIMVVGPCIFTHKFLKAMNLINADYNEKG